MVAYSCVGVSNMRWIGCGCDWMSTRFDDSKFILPLRHAAALGIDFTTMADVGDTAQNRRTLYELNKTCSSDWMTAFGRGCVKTLEARMWRRISAT
jgi:hypothetical protein